MLYCFKGSIFDEKFEENSFIVTAHAFKLKAFILFENLNSFNDSFHRPLAPPSI